MSYILAVFRNRTASMSFANHLRKLNVGCDVISTPKELGSTCSVSVKFNPANLQQAKYVLNGGRFSTFSNFYKVVNIGHRRVFEVER